MTSDESDVVNVKSKLLLDFTLSTPVPWMILGCVTIGIWYAVSTWLDLGKYPTCSCAEWNSVQHEWKINNCSIYGNETTNNDTWSLCNMFINVNEMHNPQYNWFQTVHNYNSNYSENMNINISACDWDFISCNDDGHIISMYFSYDPDLRPTFCADLNVTYMPHYLEILGIEETCGGFEFDLFSQNSLPYLHSIVAYSNNISGDVNLTNLPHVSFVNLRYNPDIRMIDFTNFAKEPANKNIEVCR